VCAASNPRYSAAFISDRFLSPYRKYNGPAAKMNAVNDLIIGPYSRFGAEKPICND
jgi:hypothetical protein